jgi:hypothetical protein
MEPSGVHGVSFGAEEAPMRIALVVLVPALCAGLASSAWADKDKDKGHGRGHGPPSQAPIVQQPVRVIVPDRDRTIVYTYYRTEFGAGRCPPGLAKKGNGCQPPGQAGRLWVVGQPLPPTVVYYPLPPPLVQQLAPVPPGYEYVQVDNDVLLMDTVNRMVADVIDDLNEPD